MYAETVKNEIPASMGAVQLFTHLLGKDCCQGKAMETLGNCEMSCFWQP